MKAIDKIFRGCGLAVEIIVIVDFLEEVYKFIKSYIRKKKAQKKEEETMDEPQ